MSYRSKISDYIDAKKEEMIRLLQRLAAIPSVRTEEKDGLPYGEEVDRILKTVLTEASALGLTATCFENRADLIDLNDKETALAILCHLDVVSADPEGWNTSPFSPTVRGNMIYGRGVSDNKGPCVAALYALCTVKALGIRLKHNVRLYLGGSEENRQDDLVHYLQKNTLPPYVFTPDGCFPVGNAERGRIVLTCHADFASRRILSVTAGKGVNSIPDYAVAHLTDGKIETFGKSTHAAHPQEGDNALTALLKQLSCMDETIQKLSEHFPHGVFDGSGLGLCGGLDLSLTQLKIQNGKIFFTADGRVDLGVSAKSLAETIRKNISFPVQITVHEPHFVPEHSELVKRLNRVYEACTEHKGTTYTLDAMTYAHHIDGAVIFGGVLPDDGSCNAHGTNECYNLNTLTESAKIFAGTILEFCETEES